MPQSPDPRRRKTITGLTPARKSAQADATNESATPAGGSTCPFRVGHGYDIHRLEAGGRTVLAGIIVSDEVGPIAHSDGDVVIHALVDALLGAIGMGDIGELFPDSDPQWKGAASRAFLETAYAKVRNAGFKLANADITILAERPRIAGFKAEMVGSLHQLFAGDGAINIKAGTNEGCDAIGRGEAIAAHAVVLLAQHQ